MRRVVPDPNAMAIYTVRYQCRYSSEGLIYPGGPRRYADVHGRRVLTWS